MVIESGMLLHLFEMLCVIIVVAYFITRTDVFIRVHESVGTPADKLFLILVFGALSVFGTLSGFDVFGAPANIRDLGPMVAGITCGPLIGGGAGIIGAVHRLTIGGYTAVPCAVATILSGIFGGLFYLWTGKKLVKVSYAVIFAAFMEMFHMVIVLAFSPDFSKAFEIVSQVAVSMIAVNTIGMFIFTTISSNYFNERKTRKERDMFLTELERKKAELKVASEIQEHLLPKGAPGISGYDLAAISVPAREVGGDFYDMISLNNGNTGLVIADVSGKSVPAAIFMALSDITVKSTAVFYSGSASTVCEANKLISHESESGMFVTMFYCVLDSDNHTLTYTNAGHNPPFVLRSKTREFETLEMSGMAVGVFDDEDYSEAEIGLNSGDIVLFYTDGVTEAVNPDGEMFGTERLKNLVLNSSSVSSDEIIQKIMGDLSVFCKDAAQFDDITLMLLKRESK